MDNKPLTPPGSSLLGSKRRDRLLGMAIGVAWWVLGSILVVKTGGQFASAVALFLSLAFLAHLVFLGRKKGGGTMVVTIFLTAVVFPVVITLCLLGQCAMRGFNR